MAIILNKNTKKVTYADALIVGSVVILGIVTLTQAPQSIATDSTEILLPSSDGTHTQWRPKDGVSHSVMVDETRCNGITDYNYTNVVGYRDSYGINLDSIPDGATVTSVEITPCASFNRTGVGSAAMDVFYIYNGVQSADAGAYILSTGITPTELSATTFSGLALVKSSSSTVQIGAVLSAGDRGVRLGRIAATLTYIPMNTPLNLAVRNVAQSQNDLSWTDDSSTEDGFKIERSQKDQLEPFLHIATTSANMTSYRNTGLRVGETYYYRVRAFNSGGDSGYSNTVSVTNQ